MITLATFVKNERECLPYMLSSIEDYVQEIVVVDTGSTDGTQDCARCFTDHVYEVGFTDFGKIRTLTAHLASQPWVLMLDADETLSNPELLVELIKSADTYNINAYSFSRFRWLDLEMTQQTEIEAFPDPQVRFFRNNKNFIWKRALHEYFHGAAVYHADLGPSINHFHDVWKTPERKIERAAQYLELAKLAGVTPEGGHEI